MGVFVFYITCVRPSRHYITPASKQITEVLGWGTWYSERGKFVQICRGGRQALKETKKAL